MKWVVIVSFIVYLATFSEGGALRCEREIGNGCIAEKTHKDTNSQNNVRESNSSGAECLAGSEWANTCYKCRCSDVGRALCTLLDVCKDVVFEERMICKPFTIFKKDCNTCTCMDNGRGSECTKMDCLSVTDRPEVKNLREGRECLPGSRWLSQCNSCWCSSEGYPICTLKACPGQEQEPEKSCLPFSEWKIECNTCSCSPAGRATCTKMGCGLFIISDFNPERIMGKQNAPQTEKHPSLGNHNIFKRSRVCKPNVLIKFDCNFCKCAIDGGSYSCTLNECLEQDDDVVLNIDDNMGTNIADDVEVFMESKDADHIEHHSVCKPRGTFHIGCNTCQCNIDGTDFTCTNKPCPLPEDVEVFDEIKVLRTSSKIVCPANRMFIKDCNTCWCNEDGTSYFCTRKVCINELPEPEVENVEKPESLQEIKRKCRPDEVFELDCNMCRCAVDGMSFSCTRRACVPEEDGKNTSLARKVRASVQGTLKSCQPGQEFRMDCNKCLCNNEGQDYSCTRIDCAALNSNGNSGTITKRDVATQLKTECEPGTVFNQGCNTCRCTEDGNHATCTVKRCKEDKPDENELNLPESDPSFRCNPGEQFKRDCNDCTCSADGKSVFCTLRLCDLDISSTII